MNIVSLKNTAMTASFLVAVVHAGITLAHSLPNGALGSGAVATDVYKVTCSNEDGGSTPTFRLSSRVKDKAPVAPPLVSVMLTKGGMTGIPATVTDPIDGNASYSPWTRLNKGNGVYTMIVKKSAAGSELYAVDFHCEGPASSGFTHTGTAIRQTQNQ